MGEDAVRLDPEPVAVASTLKIGLVCVLFGFGALYFDGVLRFICVIGFLASLGLILFVHFTTEKQPLVLDHHAIRSGKTDIVFDDVRDLQMVDAKAWDNNTLNTMIRALRMDGSKAVISLGSYARDPRLVAAIEAYLKAAYEERSADIGPALLRIRSLIERGKA